MKKARKVKDNVEIQTGVQLHKIININLIGGAIRAIQIEGPNCIFTPKATPPSRAPTNTPAAAVDKPPARHRQAYCRRR